MPQSKAGPEAHPEFSVKLGKSLTKALQLHMLLDLYKAEKGGYPYRLEELLGYLGATESMLKDDWGRRFTYYSNGRRYVLLSFGKSGKPSVRRTQGDNDEEADIVLTNGCFVGVPDGIGGTGGCSD